VRLGGGDALKWGIGGNEERVWAQKDKEGSLRPDWESGALGLKIGRAKPKAREISTGTEKTGRRKKGNCGTSNCKQEKRGEE